MTDTATHEGVVDADATATDIQSDASNQERPKSARELAMEELGSARAGVVFEEAGIEQADVDAQIDAQTTDQDSQADAVATQAVKVKIDGEEREVTQEELIRAFQKNSAADKRLEEASRLLREAKDVASRVTTQQVDTQSASGKPPAGDTTSPAADDDEAFERFVSTLYEGDKDAAKAAFKDLYGKGRQPEATLDAGKIVEEVKQQLEIDNALANFRRDFKEIFDDPYLAELADRNLHAELNRGTHATFGDAMTAAGNATRDWMKSKGMIQEKPEEKSPTVDLKPRLERKATLTSVPTAATRQPSPDSPEEARSPAQAIEEMRKARGQA